MPEERRIPALVDRGREIAPSLVEVVERALGNRSFILGDAFSAADITLTFGLMIAQYLGYVNDDTPRIRAYCERTMSRPAYQRAIEA